MIAYLQGGGEKRFIQAVDSDPYYFLRQASAQEGGEITDEEEPTGEVDQPPPTEEPQPEPDVQEVVPEEGGTTAEPTTQPPTDGAPLTVEAHWDSTDGNTAPATFLFEADAEGGTEPYTYSWDFGDGQQATGQYIHHTYENPGTYTATVTVTDSAGQTASDTTSSIQVVPAPTTEPPTTNRTTTNATTPTNATAMPPTNGTASPSKCLATPAGTVYCPIVPPKNGTVLLPPSKCLATPAGTVYCASTPGTVPINETSPITEPNATAVLDVPSLASAPSSAAGLQLGGEESNQQGAETVTEGTNETLTAAISDPILCLDVDEYGDCLCDDPNAFGFCEEPGGGGGGGTGECPPGYTVDAFGNCLEPCPDNMPRDINGNCTEPDLCPDGQQPDAFGNCPEPPCPDGQPRDPATGNCPPPPEPPTPTGGTGPGGEPPEPCPDGQPRDPATGNCPPPPEPEPCPDGQPRDPFTGNCPPPPEPEPCPDGQPPDASGNCPERPCPDGQPRDSGGICPEPPLCGVQPPDASVEASEPMESNQEGKTLICPAPPPPPPCDPKVATCIPLTPLSPRQGNGYYSYVPTSMQYGQQKTIDSLIRIANEWYNLHPNGPRIGIGSISFEGGGPFPPHKSHQTGMDVDIRVMLSGTEGNVRWQDPNYDRDLTRELIQLIRQNGNIKTIYFNDPQLISEGIVKYWPRHDNHLHVRFAP
jgi:PKD repeat protein